jgi:S1-C subfamily serine protease
MKNIFLLCLGLIGLGLLALGYPSLARAQQVQTNSHRLPPKKNPPPAGSQGSNPEKIVAEIHPAIVQIECGMFSKIKVLGTGFIVSAEAHILTAAHVLSLAGKCASPLVGLEIPDVIGTRHSLQGTFEYEPFRVVEVDQKHDIALLKMIKNPFRGELLIPFAALTGPNQVTVYEPKPSIVRLGTGPVSFGEAVATSGYPKDSAVMLTQAGIIAGKDYLPDPDAYSDPNQSDLTEIDLVDFAAHPGNSGGPLYDMATGVILGICDRRWVYPATWESDGADVTLSESGDAVARVKDGKTEDGIEVSSGISEFIPIRYAIDLLKKNHVSFFPDTQK